MAEAVSTLATWRVGGQIDESALTGISQFADIVVVATLVGASGQNVVDPTNSAHDLRGPYTTVVGGIAGTATTHPTTDGNATLAGRLWWTEPLKATNAALPENALQPSGLAWQIAVTTTTRRGDSHTLATFVVGVEGDRDYTTELETILVPSGTGGADETAINVTFLVTPPVTVVNNTFAGRVLDVLDENGISGLPELPVAGTTGQSLVKNSDTDYDVEWATISGGSGLPVGGTTGQALTKATGTNYDVTWSTIVGGGSGTLPAGYIDGSDFVNPNKITLWNGVNGSGSMAAGDSTADFQALFDYIEDTVWVTHGQHGGITVLIPRGRYLMLGTVNIPNMTTYTHLVVDATNAVFLYKPQGGVGAALFKTSLPTDANNAEVLNDLRNHWTWRGGYYDGDNVTGEICFELNAVSRMVMERVVINGFRTGIRGRFLLHFLLRDSGFNGCGDYGIRVEASGGGDAWSGATPGNAASNGLTIQNCRFYGSGAEIAQVRIAHSGHTIRDCTFEGGGPSNTGAGGGYNIMFENQNTSALTALAENLWFENSPAVAHFYVNTYHQYEIDAQYVASSSQVPVADIRTTSLTRLRRFPWGMVVKLDGAGGFSPGDTNGGVRLLFDYAGTAGFINMADAAMWAGGVRPRNAVATGVDSEGSWRMQTYHYYKCLSELKPPNGFFTVGQTTPVVWTALEVFP